STSRPLPRSSLPPLSLSPTRPPPLPTPSPSTPLFRSLLHGAHPARDGGASRPPAGRLRDCDGTAGGSLLRTRREPVRRAAGLQEIGRAHVELQSNLNIVCRVLLGNKQIAELGPGKSLI